MAEAKPVLHAVHLLASTTVILSVSGETVAGPRTLLNDYEADAALAWVDSSNVGDRFVKADQGVSGSQAIDAACIPAGHNLAGQTVKLQSSPDNAAWTDRATVVPAGSGAFRLVGVAPWTTRYTRVLMASPAAAPSMAELYVTRTVPMPRFIEEGAGFEALIGRTSILQSGPGHKWGAELGTPAWQAQYRVRDLLLADRDALRAAYVAAGGGAKPIFLLDADDTLRFVWWLNPTLSFDFIPVYSFATTLSFEEAT